MGMSIFSCATPPKGFTYQFKNVNTGLDKLINIDGYYLSEECDSMYISLFMFYSNGLCRFARTEKDGVDYALNSFKDEGKELNPHISWGIYHISNDTIFGQFIEDQGIFYGDYSFYTNYKILPNKRVMITSHVNEEGKIVEGNKCNIVARFYPLEKKRDWKECPWLKKKWFWKK